MTAKPRRYVRVRRNPEYVRAWEVHCEFCGELDSDYFADRINADIADPHARTCPAVKAAMQRDSAIAIAVGWARMHGEECTKAAELAAELATERAETSHLRADRAAWRTQAIRAEAELIAMREERA